MTSTNRSRLLLLCAALCFLAVGIALISQHVFDFAPCAWCTFQRLIYLVVGVVCLIAATGPAMLGRITAGLAALVSIGGILAAWYQHSVAAEMVSCDRTFADQFMVKSGLDGAFPSIFGIFATCMDAKVNVLGVEYAIWSLMLFVVLTVLTGYAALKAARTS